MTRVRKTNFIFFLCDREGVHRADTIPIGLTLWMRGEGDQAKGLRRR